MGGENLEAGATGSQDGKKALYHCNYCNKDISGTIRIKCAKCPDFDLCLECFSVGAEVTPHKSNHSYRVIDNLCFPLIHPDWNADEEILLLEGVEMYGLGNWAEVAEHVATKTKAQCYDHYMSSYMNSPCSPLPDMVHVHGKTKAELLAMAKTHLEGKKGSTVGEGTMLKPAKQEPSVSPARVKLEERDVSGDGRSPSSFTVGSGNEAENGEGRAFGGKTMTATINAVGMDKKPAVAGQNKEVSEGTAGGEDGGQSNRSIGVKKPKPLLEDSKAGTTILDQSGYNPKRQEFDPEYDNDAELPLAEMEFKENDTDADHELKLRMLHIYLSRLDERKRRKEFILERGLLDVNRQQALDKKRSKEERELYQRTRIFMRYHSSEEHEALLEGLNAERRIRQRIADLQECRRAGCRTLAEADQYKLEKKKREEAALRKAKESPAYLPAGKGLQRSNRNPTKEKIDGGELDSSGNHADSQKGKGGLTTISSGAIENMNKASSKSGTWDLTGLPGATLLSLTEQQLCCQNRIFPAHYLRMKEVMMLESLKSGQIKRLDTHRLIKEDPCRVDAVFDLLLQMGWIQSDDVVATPTEKC